MRFKKTLAGVGLTLTAAALALAVGAPANATTPAPSPASIQFDVSANNAAGTFPQPGGHFTIASPTGFKAGQPVDVSFQNLSGVQGAISIVAPYFYTGWTQAASTQVTPGVTISSLAEMGGTTGGVFNAYVRGLVVPTAGDTAIHFNFAPVNSGSLPSDVAHVTMASDNYFQAGSTTTTTIAVNDPVNLTQVSLDGGATWSATGASFTSRPGDMNPSIMTKSVWGGTWYYATLSNMASPQIALATAATPVVGDPVIDQNAATITYTGTGTAGDTIIIRDSTGATIGTATVAADGTWTIPLTNPTAGPGTIAQTGPGKVESADVPITIPVILGTPIVNPLIAGGATLGLIAGLGTVVLIRRRKAAVEA